MPAQDRVQAHPDSYLAELRADVRAGLTAEPKSLPPKYFYDERGSELFEEITRLPEYYPTRAETAILQARAGEIAELSQCESLVELGSGTSAKTGLVLRALRERGTLREFMPFDVDPAVLANATEALAMQYPGLRIVPFVGDFERETAAMHREYGLAHEDRRTASFARKCLLARRLVEQGVRFFRDEAYLEEGSARREAERGTFDPAYILYSLGKLMVLKLREDYEAARTDRYSPRAFHDALLANGTVPLWLHRNLLLGEQNGSMLE